MIDILGYVYDFILKYAQGEGVPPLEQNQIIRGWQNSAVLPTNTEFVVITLLNSYRKGRNVHIDKPTNDDFSQTLDKLTEHVVQIDFCSNDPITATHLTQHRAELFETVASSYVACDFFKSKDKRLNYINCDGLYAFSEMDETQSMACRYMMTIHISEHVQVNLNLESFSKDEFKLKIKEIDTFFKNGDINNGNSVK